MSAKIYFSPREHALLQDQEFILTKRAVIDKVYALFASQVNSLQRNLLHKKISLEQAVLETKPKIFKGENLNGFPYVMMDYPAVFGKEDIFAIRTLFWWGQQLAVYLIVKGRYIASILPQDALEQYFAENSTVLLGIHTDPWRHDFEMDNFLPFTSTRVYNNNGFIKLGVKISLTDQQNYDHELSEAYKAVANILLSN